jgi:predicted nucleic acid-binding Zn ribbon protein
MTKVNFWKYMTKKTPICPVCGKKIPFNSRMIKYCSTKCSREHNRLRMAQRRLDAKNKQQ